MALFMLLGVCIAIYTFKYESDSSYSHKESVEPDSLPARAPIDVSPKVIESIMYNAE